MIDGTRPYPMGKVGRFPTEAELDAWEKACPGSVAKLREMARHQAEHRVQLENMNRNLEKHFIFFAKLLTLLYSTTIVILLVWFLAEKINR
jgi:hypothetical protein